MEDRIHFAAPWGRSVVLVTTGVLGVLVLVAVATPAWMVWLPIAIAIGAAAFAVRGYSVMDGEVVVLRAGWSTRLPIANVQDVRHEPGVTRGSLRVFGIGGLFGWIGLFRNSLLGRYRAYLTDPDRTVVLTFADGLPVVVSPDDPEAFVAAVREWLP